MKSARIILILIIFIVFSCDGFAQSIQKNAGDTSSIKKIEVQKKYKVGDTIIKTIISPKKYAPVTYDTIIVTAQDTAVLNQRKVKQGIIINSKK